MSRLNAFELFQGDIEDTGPRKPSSKRVADPKPSSNTSRIHNITVHVKLIYNIVVVVLAASILTIGIDYGLTETPFYDPSVSEKVTFNDTTTYENALPHLSVTAASLSFLAVSLICHVLAVCMPEVLNEPSRFDIHRWVDYSISAPLMMLEITAVVGLTDVSTLITTFGSMFGCIVLGALNEYHTFHGVKMRIIGILAWIPFILSWSVIFNAARVADVPGFVVLILCTLFVFFCIFPAIHIYAQTRPTPLTGAMYLFIAMLYAVVGLGSKISLAFMLYFGAKARGEGDNPTYTVAYVLAAMLSLVVILCVFAIVRFKRM